MTLDFKADEFWMEEALREGQRAQAAGEVVVGDDETDAHARDSFVGSA